MIIPVLLFSPLALEAQTLKDASKALGNTGEKAFGVKKAPNLPELIGRIIRIFLTMLGVIFTVLLVYGGTLWMTSYGNEQKVTKAKDLITSAVIGLIIILAAYAITAFVVSQLVKQVTT